MRDKIILGFKTSIAPLRGAQPTPANCETAIKYNLHHDWKAHRLTIKELGEAFPEILEVVYGQD
jgi:hypothetical protein